MRNAVMEGNLQKVKRLLDGGTNPNARGSNGFAAIHIAAINNRGEIITELARHGADVNLRASRGETAFELAVRGAQPEALESLLAAHAMVVPIGNEDPLQFATKRFYDSEAGVRNRGGDPHYDPTLQRMNDVIVALRHHGDS